MLLKHWKHERDTIISKHKGRAIKTNAKIIALREALKSAFAHQISEGLNQKAVVFTESKRTQKYIAAELRKSGYSEEDILVELGNIDQLIVLMKDAFQEALVSREIFCE